MLDAKIFHQHREICSKCPNWKGVCLKGHVLQSPVGCPEKRFPPVEGAAYMEDRPATVAEPVVPGKCCGGAASDQYVKELSYAEALKELAASLRTWQVAGYPTLSDADYGVRTGICKSNTCGFYKWFQCRACKCVIFIKAKLKTTECPARLWPRV